MPATPPQNQPAGGGAGGDARMPSRPAPVPRARRIRFVATMLAFGAAYFLAAEAGRFGSSRETSYVSLWLPAGLYLGVLLLHEIRAWPALVLVAFAANLGFELAHGIPWFTAVLFFGADTLGAVLGACAVRRGVSARPTLQSLREFLGFVLCTTIVGTASSATVGAAIVTSSGFASGYWAAWQTWWWGQGIAILLIAPFLLTWFRPGVASRREFARLPRVLEAGALLGGLLVFTAYVLLGLTPAHAPDRLLLIPFFIWAAVRFGVRGVAATNLVLALAVAGFGVGAAAGGGPGAAADQAQVIHTFLAITALVGLITAVVLGERDRTVAELRQGEVRFRHLTAAAFEGVFITEHGRIVDANEQGLRMLGQARASVIGRSLAELVRAEVGAFESSAASATLPTEHQVMRPDGGRIHVEAQVRTWPEGDRILCLVALRDITARKRVEESLRENRAKLVLAMDMAKLGHWEFDVRTGRFRFEENFYRLLRTSTAREGGSWMAAEEYARRFVAPEAAALVAAEVGKAIATSDPNFTRQLEHRFIRADGTEGMMSVRFAIVKDASGATIKTYGVNQDITEQKLAEQQRLKLEEQLRQAQKMEAIGTLAGGIAHDFNNILTGIMGNLQLAELDLPPGHPARALLHDASTAGRRARDLVARILTFSRRDEPDLVPIALAPVVHEALQLLRASLPATIGIQHDLVTGCPPVLCDAGQMHQVIINLGVNAADAMRERGGGVIEVHLRHGEPAPEWHRRHAGVRPEHVVHLSVRDSGCGMSAEQLHRIFEPFYTTKPPGKGTGLGLSVVHGIMEAHGGVVVVDSALDAGTTVHLLFPRCDQAAPAVLPVAPAPATASPPVGGATGPRVLVVDDEPAVLRVATLALKRAGYRPESFARATDALAAFRSDPAGFAALVTDLTMPEMTGLELAHALRAIRPDVPVILASGRLPDDARDEINRMPGAYVLEKPYAIDRLASELAAALGRR